MHRANSLAACMHQMSRYYSSLNLLETQGSVHTCIQINTPLPFTSHSYPYLFDNLADLWLKTHVKHPVSFIYHQICASPQVGDSSLQEIYQSARSRNNNFHTTFQITCLSNYIMHYTHKSQPPTVISFTFIITF